MKWLAPPLELGINTALAPVNLVIDSIQSYTEDLKHAGLIAADWAA